MIRIVQQSLGMLLVSAAAIALAGLTACSSSATRAGPAVDPSQVQVYRSMQVTPTRYKIVEHIWVDSWRSNMTYPSFATEGEGVEAMKREAGRLGANGIMHVICLDPSSGQSKSARLLCYGDAVKVN
jgi:hypothetical protein